jgi:hypothetical protein
MPNIIYIPDSTWTDLDQEPIFQKFMKEYIDLLQNSLTKIKIKSDSNNTSHYTFICGQPHDRRNPSWQHAVCQGSCRNNLRNKSTFLFG